MKKYNKLIRDNIPQICEKNKQIATTRVLGDEEYLKHLHIKLKEEVKEYLESEEIEELADVEEVLRAILNAKKVSYKNFEEIRKNKVAKNGAFKKRLLLLSVEDK